MKKDDIMNTSRSALLVIDVQNDFCPGGALAVKEGDLVVPVINGVMERFGVVAATQDWHPADHVSFASNNSGKKPFDVIALDGIEQTLWPDHCVRGTAGADFHGNLNTVPFDLILRKGTDPKIDSYSAFMENDRKTVTGLEGYLRKRGVEEIYLCGLATDVCVFYSAIDGTEAGFRTSLILDACRGIDVPAGTVDSALSNMKEKGIEIIQSRDL